jgi:hypothetical protein
VFGPAVKSQTEKHSCSSMRPRNMTQSSLPHGRAFGSARAARTPLERSPYVSTSFPICATTPIPRNQSSLAAD